ncbi:MAG: hypothetical protein OEQ18_14525 [Gammaproteobacteria bacterium]|nr:hypothetical protein [Gammaproteobacteria bacterium]
MFNLDRIGHKRSVAADLDRVAGTGAEDGFGERVELGDLCAFAPEDHKRVALGAQTRAADVRCCCRRFLRDANDLLAASRDRYQFLLNRLAVLGRPELILPGAELEFRNTSSADGQFFAVQRDLDIRIVDVDYQCAFTQRDP